MGFVKVVKDNAYYKRFQVKFRRRREGKTDYYARKRLVTQRKNKYATPKWRLVVRITCSRIIAQFVRTTLQGDIVKTQADSSELKKWGLTAGLNNFSAAYCTGLLAARRLLAVLDKENAERNISYKMSDLFNMKPETDGTYFNFEELLQSKGGADCRPFRAYLDVGIRRTTVGNKVFAALKGAVDGGVDIPHKEKVFPKGKTGTELRDRIFGKHVSNYMEHYKANRRNDQLTYEQHFGEWIKCLKATGSANLEALYKKVQAGIRADPSFKPTTKKAVKVSYSDKDRTIVTSGTKPYLRHRRLSLQQRKDRVLARIQKWGLARQNR